MNPIHLLTVTALIAGAGCFALAKQKSGSANATRKYSQPVSITANPQSLYPAAEREMMRKLRQAEPLLDEAQTDFDKGRYAHAETLSRQVLALLSDDPVVSAKALLLLAQSSEKQGKQQAALHAYHALIFPDKWQSSIGHDPTTRMRYVLALCRSNQYRDAAQVYNQTLTEEARVHSNPLGLTPMDTQYPNERQVEAAAHLMLGTRSPLHGPPSDAQWRHLQAAVRLQPDWKEAQTAYRDALRLRKQRQELQNPANNASAALKR